MYVPVSSRLPSSLPRVLPTETKAESGTSQSKSGTSLDSSNSQATVEEVRASITRRGALGLLRGGGVGEARGLVNDFISKHS